MTAPTQGKERGAASAPRGPFPRASSPFPSLLSRRRSLRAPRRTRPSAPCPRGSPAAPDLCNWHLIQPRSRSSSPACLLLAGPRGAWLMLGDAGTPSPPAQGAGGRGGWCLSRSYSPFQGRASVCGPPLGEAAGGCAPSDPGSTASQGYLWGWSAQGGRDPAPQGSGGGKTSSG